MMNCGLVLHSEKCFQRLISLVYKYRYVILGTLFIGVLAHMFMFTNKLPNHDDVHSLFSVGTTMASGRWGLRILALFLPGISMSWLYGILSLILFAASSCLIVRTFDIKSPFFQFLLGGVVVSFPTQTATFGYMFTAFAYAIAFFLAVLVVYFVRAGWKLWLPAAVSMVLSLSIYQGYLSVTVSMLILCLICRLLKYNECVSKLWLNGLLYIAFLVGSLGVYWLITKGLWHVSGSKMGQYADTALVFSLRSVIEGIPKAYSFFGKILFERYGGLIPTNFVRILHLVLFGFCLLETAVVAVRFKSWKRSMLLLFLLAVLPLGIHCMFLFIAEKAIHTLVMYSFIAFYLLTAIFMEHGRNLQINCPKARVLHGLAIDCSAVILAIIMLCNVNLANEAYMQLHLRYETSYSVTTTMLAQLQNTPGYTKDSKVAILGKYDEPGYQISQFRELGGMMGAEGINPNSYSYKDFIAYYMGADINWATAEECERIQQTEAYKQMEIYPDYGSIQQIENVFVIKFSN